MTVRFIFTCCILDNEREDIYVKAISDSVSKLNHLPIKLYVVENTGRQASNLDTIKGIEVVYTNNNLKDDFGEKGIKEMFDMHEVAGRYAFDDDDIVIKLTGRYTLKSAKFVEEVINNKDIYDCFIKCYNVCTEEYDDKDCIMSYYGIRYRYFQDINIMSLRSNYSMEMALMSELYKAIEPGRIWKTRQLDMYFRGMESGLL
jgi:hypothetical protein